MLPELRPSRTQDPILFSPPTRGLRPTIGPLPDQRTKTCRLRTVTRETAGDCQVKPRICSRRNPGFPTKPRLRWSRELVLQSDPPVAGPVPLCPLLEQNQSELAPLDLVTDHFFLAGHLGPGCFQTRSWSFRSKHRLAFIKKQSTPVLLGATLCWAR